jgi:hypothetical protein
MNGRIVRDVSLYYLTKTHTLYITWFRAATSVFNTVFTTIRVLWWTAESAHTYLNAPYLNFIFVNQVIS